MTAPTPAIIPSTIKSRKMPGVIIPKTQFPNNAILLSIHSIGYDDQVNIA